MTTNEMGAMLTDSARRYVERGYGAEVRAASCAHAHGCDPRRWAELAELGWLALPIDEAHGGLGGSLGDVCTVAEELGRGLVVEPFAASVAASWLLAASPDEALKREWLARMAGGTVRLAVAEGVSAAACRAEAWGEQWVLHGDFGLAPGAAGADALVVCVPEGAAGTGVFLVGRDAEGMSLQSNVLYDGRHAATVRMGGVAAKPVVLAVDVAASDAIDRARDAALVVHAAETVGAMSRAFEITRDYVTTRRQFGKPIGSNQVIQHRLVDLYVEIEEARALVHACAAAPTPRLAAATAAHVAQAARQVWEESIQLHGAIGMTEEYVLGAYVRRLALASTLHGCAHEHLARVAALSLGEIAHASP